MSNRIHPVWVYILNLKQVLAGSRDGVFACRLGSEHCLPNNRVRGRAPPYIPVLDIPAGSRSMPVPI